MRWIKGTPFVHYAAALVVAFASCLIVLLATSRYGAGVSTDSVNYLAAADHFSSGDGILDYSGKPLILWPPLYPLLLGGLKAITGLPAFELGRYLNTVIYGLIVFLPAVLFQRSFHGSRYWFYLGLLIGFSSVSILYLASNISSDPLFISLILIYTLVAQDFLREKRLKWLILLIFLSALTPLIRLVGISFIVISVVLVWVAYWDHKPKALTYSVMGGILASIPILAWGLGRNYRISGTLFGAREFYKMLPLENLKDMYFKMSLWFMPQTILNILPFVVFILLFLIAALFFNRSAQWFRLGRRLVDRNNLPHLLLSVLNLGLLLYTVVTIDHVDQFDDRYYVPAYIPIMILFFICVDELFMSHIGVSRRKYGYLFLFILVLSWSLYPIYGIYKFVRISMESGVSYYNNYNHQDIQDSSLARFLDSFEFNSEIPIYSNVPPLVYFNLNRDVLPSPRFLFQESSDPGSQPAPMWPNEKAAYFIWIESEERRDYYDPSQIGEVVDLTVLFEGKVGGVYLVNPVK